MNKLFLIIVAILAFSSCQNTNKQKTTTDTRDTMVVVPDTTARR